MTRGVPPLLPWQPCLLAAIAGILACQDAPAAVAGLFLLALFPRPAPGRPATWHLVAAFLVGWGAGWLALPPLPASPPACLESGKRVDIVGRVDELDPRPENRLSCLLTDVRLTGQGCEAAPLPGRLALTIDAPLFRPLPGDSLAVTAKVRPTRGFTNPGVTDFVFLRRLDGVFYRAYARGGAEGPRLVAAGGNALAQAREDLRRRVTGLLAPPPEADAASRAGRAMVTALVFADLSDFTQADLDLIRRASLSHTLALSGMNVSYVAALGFALAWLLGRARPGVFLRLPRPLVALGLTAPLLAGYCWLGGYSPSLFRAVLMFCGTGLFLLLGRQAPLFDSLFLALGAMLAVSPLTACDARLQLSALAVAGIALLWPPFHRFAKAFRAPRPLKAFVVAVAAVLWTSLCAEAAVMPLIVRLYGEWNCNPWLNALWLPVLGFVVTPLALLGTACAAVPWLAQAGGWLLTGAAWGCQGLMAGLAWLDARHLLFSVAVLRPAWPELLGCLGLLAGLALVLAGRPRPTAALLASLALLVAPTLWRGVQDSRDRVSLTVFDVGQGQSVAVDLPGGRRLLIDGGGLAGNFDLGRAVVGASLTDNRPPRLDMVLASHPHADHIKGLVSILARFRVAALRDNGGQAPGELGQALAAALTRNAVPRSALTAGDRLDLGDGLAVSVLHPGPGDDRDGNNGSLILRLTWNGRGLAVLPGDAERGVLKRLAASGAALDAAVLVLPHHGSVSALSRRFHAAVRPRLAIASCGDTGRYPSAKVQESLSRLGCPTLATNRDGAVTVRFDGPDAPPRVETAVPRQ